MDRYAPATQATAWGGTVISQPTTTLPSVSVLIATYNRPADLARCLPTILANDYPDFEVVVADQSAGCATADVVAAIGDPRVRLIHCDARGKGHAVNHVVPHLTGAVLAMTDDDVTVPPDWLRQAVAVLLCEPRPALICGALRAIPHDRECEFVPEYVPSGFHRVRRVPLRLIDPVPDFVWSGVGANFVSWRADFEQLGGYDEWLGPGAPLGIADDLDLCYRALRAGFTLVHVPQVWVLHWGKRDGAHLKTLMARYGFGHGAAYTRNVLRGDWLAGLIFWQDVLWRLRKIAGALKRRERPPHVRYTTYMFLGAVAALRYPTSTTLPRTAE